MTQYLVDIASYQAGMDLAVVKRAGFSLVNIKTTQGVRYIHQAAPAWADKARALGLGISTFHWLDNSASGRAQADYAFAQIKAMGGPAGMAHQVDCEDSSKPATLTILRDYIIRMQDLLGRHVVVYTGDWWWQPRGWKVTDLTPYAWAAPNAGYLKAYPGDTSPSWRAGYGGWGDYSLLQYAVSPIANAGGGDISKSAVRDPQVWAALTGAKPAPPTPLMEVDMPAYGKLATDTTVWVSDGMSRRPMSSPSAWAGLTAVGAKVAVFQSDADLTDALGPVATPTSAVTVSVTPAELADAVREVLRGVNVTLTSS